jgi:hypothetical protein
MLRGSIFSEGVASVGHQDWVGNGDTGWEWRLDKRLESTSGKRREVSNNESVDWVSCCRGGRSLYTYLT